MDVDFPAVYREMAGLDSILQAAGRCNREGKRSADESIVTIFEREELPPMLFRTAIGAAREAMDGGRDPGDMETMARYFRSLRSLTGDAIDKQRVIQAFEQGIKLIDQDTYTIYVPADKNGEELVRRLEDGECSRGLYRQLGRYAVSVYEPHFKALYAAGAIRTAKDIHALDDRSAVLDNMKLYSETLGLTLEPETGQALFQ